MVSRQILYFLAFAFCPFLLGFSTFVFYSIVNCLIFTSNFFLLFLVSIRSSISWVIQCCLAFFFLFGSTSSCVWMIAIFRSSHSFCLLRPCFSGICLQLSSIRQSYLFFTFSANSSPIAGFLKAVISALGFCFDFLGILSLILILAMTGLWSDPMSAPGHISPF